MRKYALLAAPLLFVLLLAGCDGTGSEGDPDAILLRLQNESSIDFSSAVVRFPEAESNFGAVAAGEASDYREFGSAYSYGYIEVEAGGDTYRIQPIDYVGEEPLENGRYTYELNIAGEELEMEFEQD